MSEISGSVMIYGRGRTIVYNGNEIGEIGIARSLRGHIDDDIASKSLIICRLETVE